MKLSHLTPVKDGIKGFLAMVIAQGESSVNNVDINYNIHNSSSPGEVNSQGKIYTKYFSRKANLSNLTMGELMKIHGDGKSSYRAVGRWQILKDPMVGFRTWAKISDDVRFTNHIQDLYVVYALLVKRKAVAAFLLGEAITYGSIYKDSASLRKRNGVLIPGGRGVPTATYAACCLAMEWSSKPMPDGKTFYSNGIDKAHVPFQVVVDALESAKLAVRDARDKGILDKASLIWVALGGSSGTVGAIDGDIRRNGDFNKYDGAKGKVSDIRDRAKIKGYVSSSTVDNYTARMISDAHNQSGSNIGYSRKADHKSVITRADAYVVERKKVNGVDLFIYSDGTINAQGPIKTMNGFKLSKRSLANLDGVHPDLVRVVKRAIELTGQDFAVIEGVRTLARQKKLYADGKSQTLNSKHLVQTTGYGHAVDLVAASPIDWTTQRKYFVIADAMSIAARELNVHLLWGGCWCDISVPGFSGQKSVAEYVQKRRGQGKAPFLDFVHFEVV